MPRGEEALADLPPRPELPGQEGDMLERLPGFDLDPPRPPPRETTFRVDGTQREARASASTPKPPTQPAGRAT